MRVFTKLYLLELYTVGLARQRR